MLIQNEWFCPELLIPNEYNDRYYSSSGYRRIVNAVDVLWLLIHVGIEIYLYWGCANLKQKCHLHQN